MNYSKIVRTVTGIMAFVGFFMLMGIAGTCDYLDAIHQGWMIAPVLFKSMIAFILILPFVILQNYGKDDEDDE